MNWRFAAPKRKFDGVEMKREGARAVYGQIKNMTREEELACWRARTDEMLKEQAELRNKAKRGKVADKAAAK